MFSHQILNILIIITSIFSLHFNECFCINLDFENTSLANSFSSAVATWYGAETGSGSGGGCGFENDISKAPYNGLIAAGNQNIYQHGKGCGTCYQVKCTQHPSCSRKPITITITDECPGLCNNDAFHFDLSGKAFGYLAKRGQGYTLRKAGRINIEYRRVPCHYRANLVFKIDIGSNPYYLAFAVEDVNIDGDLGSVELLPSNSRQWMPMQQSWGETWQIGIPSGVHGPYSVKLTAMESRRSIVAYNVIPANWARGLHYYSKINF